MTQRDERDSVPGPPTPEGHGEHGRPSTPQTWPRDPRDRTAPGNRLTRALSLAGRSAELRNGEDGSIPAGPGAFQRAFSDILGLEDSGRQPVGRVEAATKEAAETPLLAIDVRAEEPHVDIAPRSTASDRGLGEDWGRFWEESVQGWVATPAGETVWRPVVSTTDTLAGWDVGTYLGVVTAEVAIPVSRDRRLGADLASARRLAIDGLVAEAVERGAHAIVGVSMQYVAVELAAPQHRLLLTVTGTAVTLTARKT